MFLSVWRLVTRLLNISLVNDNDPAQVIKQIEARERDINIVLANTTSVNAKKDAQHALAALKALRVFYQPQLPAPLQPPDEDDPLGKPDPKGSEGERNTTDGDPSADSEKPPARPDTDPDEAAKKKVSSITKPSTIIDSVYAA